MKKNYFLNLMTLALMLLTNCAFAQSNFAKQIIIASGGDFGNPSDYVSLATYDPLTNITTVFGTIHTQSVQDVIIYGEYAFVAAQDSIVKFNIDTYEKVAEVSANGVNQIATDGNVIIASFWSPVTENFVRSYNFDDLTFKANFSEISGDASGIFLKDGIALIAIPGPWGSTTGKIASLDIVDSVVLSEDDYGEFCSNIGYFAYWNNTITAYMLTPWGETSSKAQSFDEEGNQLNEYVYENTSLANLSGQKQNKLFAEINNGIGYFNLETNELSETMVVSPLDQTIAASVIDTVNNLFYVTTTDFFSFGEGYIFNMTGENIGSFEAGISAQAIAIDYRVNTGIKNNLSVAEVSLFPNPATDKLNFNIPTQEFVNEIIISDISGKTVINSYEKSQIDISSLKTGLYFISINTNSTIFNGRFIKK